MTSRIYGDIITPNTQARLDAFDILVKDGAMSYQEERAENNTTTIAIHKSTKDKLDRIRAPGQCYNGFICQLIDLWERAGDEKVYTRRGSPD